MSVQLNHTIVFSRDNRESAEFFARIMGLEVGLEWGPFIQVTLANGVDLDFATLPPSQDVFPQHYAFLVSEAEFDAILDRIKAEGLAHTADPHGKKPGEINTNDGGRGVYFPDPSGHGLEIITVPYGGF
ncbi:chaP protein [Streptomyces spiroverticillatus]|uniref:ChaP protein n=1 Tax=Streptomyces finlayi TaxID=67296 RepID=A0A919C9N6_9ACTN|nr:VOC family protein [Streptomyces finlayi]GHA08559.1 chaP protein [Streptomyces spiroverticillatus]GHC91500.1 chaP protein [Streptomyces finlayi]